MVETHALPRAEARESTEGPAAQTLGLGVRHQRPASVHVTDITVAGRLHGICEIEIGIQRVR